MIKAFKAFFVGLVSIVLGVVWLAQPGTQGNGGGIALVLVGIFVGLRGFKLLTGAGSVQSTRSGSGGDGGTRGTSFTRRRVISPQDSRPELPFKL